jgi:AP-2 complex subunit alpha
MDDPDLGVALSVTSLVMTLAQDNLDLYKAAYPKAAARLKRIVIDGEYTVDYLYYKVPCPWFQIKLLRLLQYFPPSGKLCGTNCPPLLLLLLNVLQTIPIFDK